MEETHTVFAMFVMMANRKQEAECEELKCDILSAY